MSGHRTEADYVKQVAGLADENARLRNRIESLRGLCKSAVGYLRDAGADSDAEKIYRLIGDLEPQLKTITDGYSVWPAACAECGGVTEVVRPGRIQCGVCG